MLAVENLHVGFELPHGSELHAVRGVSFTIAPGERFALVGESGCGKSTTLMALMGLLPSNAWVSGRVGLGAADVLGDERTMRALRWKEIAMVPQGAMNALNPVRTVGRQIVEPMLVHGTAPSRRAAAARARDLFGLVGLPADRLERYPHELSGGMRQRATIAMALACDPKVLLADEPTTALDVMVQAQILALVRRLCDELSLALLLVTHDLGAVAQLCERAAVMYAGELVEVGAIDALYHDPRHPYTRRLFEATPRLRGEGHATSIAGASSTPDEAIAGGPSGPLRDRAFEPAPSNDPALLEVTLGSLARLPSQRPNDGPAPGRVSDAATGPLLDVRDLHVAFPVSRGVAGTLARRPRTEARAVDGVSLQIRAGEMLALVGESGCGKSTTSLSILGLVTPTSGSVHLAGDDITSASASELRRLRRRMQLIYQDPYQSLNPRLRVRDAVAEPLVVHGVRDDRDGRVSRALEAAGLSPPETYLDRRPHELSGGQRQRVAIAASLVLDPELLVADEPVSMLDVSVRAGVLRVLDGLRERGIGILMITHDLSTAARFADRIAVMYLGRIVEEGPAREVIERPRHPYTAALISVVPDPDPHHVSARQILAGETPDATRIPSGCRFHPRCPVRLESCSVLDQPLEQAKGAVPGHRAACVHARDGASPGAPDSLPAATP